jgi:SAM-dependent methyltransferase
MDSKQVMTDTYERRKRRLYRLLRPPLPLIHNPRESFVPPIEGIKLFIGGAGGEIPAGFLNVDLVAFPGVDLTANVEALPFADGSVAAIYCDAVLEHVSNPTRAVAEMLRVLRPGGYLHVAVPFCHPFHAYPNDYTRWSLEGLRELLREFHVLDAGMRTGPTATLLAVFLEYVKVVSPRALRKPLYALFGWLLWPLRYVDLRLNNKPEAVILASHIYALAQKPSGATVGF